MRGNFFIVFMIVMSCLAVVSTILWQYISRLNSKARASVIAIVLTLASVGALVFYGSSFVGLIDTAFFTPAFYAAMSGLSWLFMFFLIFPVLLILAIVVFFVRYFCRHRAGRSLRKSDTGTQETGRGTISRRTFLKGAATALPLVALGVSSYGNFAGETDLATTYHKLSFPDLPDYLKGYRIAQISDTHMGLFFSPQRLQEAMAAAIQ